MKATNTFDHGGFKAINLADGTNPQDAITKNQLDLAIQGIKWKEGVRAATTENITPSGAQTIDGVAVAVGDRVLLKNQTTAGTNGIYVVSASSWTRSTDANTSLEVLNSACFVSEGSVNGNSVWTMTTDASVTLDITALTYVQLGSATIYTAGTGVNISSNVVSLDLSTATRKFSAAIGDGTSTTLTVTHNLNTQDIGVSVYDTATRTGVLADWSANGINTVQFTFGLAPTTGQYRVTVVG